MLIYSSSWLDLFLSSSWLHDNRRRSISCEGQQPPQRITNKWTSQLVKSYNFIRAKISWQTQTLWIKMNGLTASNRPSHVIILYISFKEQRKNSIRRNEKSHTTTFLPTSYSDDFFNMMLLSSFLFVMNHLINIYEDLKLN